MNTPTLTLTATSGMVKLRSHLYGPVTLERKTREQRSLQHRAEQLNSARVARFNEPAEYFVEDDYDAIF